jgi:hypothetical protein
MPLPAFTFKNFTASRSLSDTGTNSKACSSATTCFDSIHLYLRDCVKCIIIVQIEHTSSKKNHPSSIICIVPTEIDERNRERSDIRRHLVHPDWIQNELRPDTETTRGRCNQQGQATEPRFRITGELFMRALSVCRENRRPVGAVCAAA